MKKAEYIVKKVVNVGWLQPFFVYLRLKMKRRFGGVTC